MSLQRPQNGTQRDASGISLPRRQGLRWLLAAAGCVMTGALPASAMAQESWKPAHPIKIVVPFPPGGGTDAAARLLADTITKQSGFAVIVENRPGANGILATQAVNTAAADGLTLMMGTSDTHAVNPHLYPQAVKAVASMIAVNSVARVPVMLVGRKNLPQKTTREVLQFARSNEMTYAHYGIGSNGQLAMEMIKANAGIDKMLGVPYQGGGPAMQAVLAGQVDIAVVPMNAALAQGPNILLLGTVSAQRPEGAKEIPTLKEQGFDVVADSWTGLFAPSATPANVVAAISRLTKAAVASPEFAKSLAAQGLSPLQLDGSAEFSKFVASESARLGKVIRAANIKVEK